MGIQSYFVHKSPIVLTLKQQAHCLSFQFLADEAANAPAPRAQFSARQWFQQQRLSLPSCAGTVCIGVSKNDTTTVETIQRAQGNRP